AGWRARAAPGAPERLERMAAEESAQGIRIHLIEPDRADELQSGRLDPVLERAGRLGLPVQYLARMSHLGAVRRAAAAFPSTPMIVGPLGHPDLDEPAPYPSARPFFDLARLPNVYAKVSLLVDHSKRDYPYPDVADYVRRTIDAFGAPRLMWGSNFPLVPEIRTEQPVD